MRERVSKRGETTYQVLFRSHGRQTSETFTDAKAAQRFAQMVDLLGADRARAEQLGDHDSGEMLTLDDLAERFFEWKATRVTARTIRDYRRDYANYWRERLGHRPAAAVTEADVRAAVDRACARLRTDRIDLLQFHAWTFADPRWLDALWYLEAERDAGRIGSGDAARVVDTSHRIEADESLAIITAKDEAGLEVIRHSTAHLLAYAVKELFPDAQVTIGPVIENGFYYDFSYRRPFTPEDLEKMIEPPPPPPPPPQWSSVYASSLSSEASHLRGALRHIWS